MKLLRPFLQHTTVSVVGSSTMSYFFVINGGDEERGRGGVDVEKRVWLGEEEMM